MKPQSKAKAGGFASVKAAGAKNTKSMQAAKKVASSSMKKTHPMKPVKKGGY